MDDLGGELTIDRWGGGELGPVPPNPLVESCFGLKGMIPSKRDASGNYAEQVSKVV